MVKKQVLVNPGSLDTTGMVSASQLMTFMSCKKKWSYAYEEGLQQRVDRPYITIGKMCHTAMQYAMLTKYQQQASGQGFQSGWCLAMGLNRMAEEYEEYLNNNIFLEEEMPDIEQTYEDAQNVFRQAWLDFKPERFNVHEIQTKSGPVPALELHFVIPCAGSKGLHGFIDAILDEIETGMVWSTDYKFRKTLEDPTEEAFNIQNAIYSKACAKMGVPITGTITWQHTNTPPSIPKLNKNGSMSRAYVKTTWAVYLNALLANNLNPEDYEDEMVPKLAEVEWCRETKEYRNDTTVNKMWASIVVPHTYGIKSAYGKKNHPSMYPWNCKMCGYRDLCQAELRDYDIDYIKSTQYTKRERGTDKSIIDNPVEV